MTSLPLMTGDKTRCTYLQTPEAQQLPCDAEALLLCGVERPVGCVASVNSLKEVSVAVVLSKQVGRLLAVWGWCGGAKS